MFEEVLRVAAEPLSAAQLRHGPAETIKPAFRAIIFARQGKTVRILLKLAGEIRAGGARVLLIGDQPFDDTPNVRLVRFESLPLGLGTLVDSIYIQLLVHELALRASLDQANSGSPRM